MKATVISREQASSSLSQHTEDVSPKDDLRLPAVKGASKNRVSTRPPEDFSKAAAIVHLRAQAYKATLVRSMNDQEERWVSGLKPKNKTLEKRPSLKSLSPSPP